MLIKLYCETLICDKSNNVCLSSNCHSVLALPLGTFKNKEYYFLQVVLIILVALGFFFEKGIPDPKAVINWYRGPQKYYFTNILHVTL